MFTVHHCPSLASLSLQIKALLCRPVLLILIQIFFIYYCTPALGQDPVPEQNLENEEINIYPRVCDFKMDFPEEPLYEINCKDPDSQDDNGSKQCVEEISFVKVFFGTAILEISAVCRPTDTENYQHYTPEVMKSTLEMMMDEEKFNDFNVLANETDNYKNAALSGITNQNGEYQIVMMNLWVSPNSLMNIEGVIKGNSNENVDRMFSRIMRSIRFEPNGKDNNPASSPSSGVPAASE